jgi:hypothetical protein
MLLLLPDLLGVIVRDRYVNYDSAELTLLREQTGTAAGTPAVYLSPPA